MEPNEKVVFLVPTKEIFYGAHARLEERLGMKVGKMGDGIRDLQQVNVVLMPSLVSALKDPSKENKVTAKERVPQIVVQEILPLFKGKSNVKALLKNYMRTYYANTKAREQIKDELTELAHSDLSDAKIQMAMNKYEVSYNKAMEKKAGKKWGAYQEALSFVESIVCVICDETHRAKGDTWFDTISTFTNAQYRIGMTGTIDYRDKMLWQKLQGLFGQVVERVANDELIEKGFSAKPFIKLVNVTAPTNISYERNYQTVYSQGIVANVTRNTMIANLCQTIYKDNKTTLIIVNRMEHGESIFKLLQERGVVSEFINGELGSDVRKRQLEDVKSGKLKVLIATTVLDEGVDISGIHCLILGAGGKSLRQTLQRVGRILRKKEGDNQAVVIDFYDRTNKYLLNHSKERHRIYTEEGFDIKFLN